MFKFVKRRSKKEDGRIVFTVPISKLYPAMAKYIQKALDKHEVPITNPYLTNLFGKAKVVGRDHFDLVLVGRDDCPPEMVVLRATTLEICRLWFTELLHQHVEQQPMKLVLEPDDRSFRL